MNRKLGWELLKTARTFERIRERAGLPPSEFNQTMLAALVERGFEERAFGEQGTEQTSMTENE